MKDDLEDPEQDVASRLEEVKSRELILIINNMFTLFVMFTNLMLLLKASKGYWRFLRVDVPFIFVYFLDVIDCRSVQVSVFTLHTTWCIKYIGLRACYVNHLAPHCQISNEWIYTQYGLISNLAKSH